MTHQRFGVCFFLLFSQAFNKKQLCWHVFCQFVNLLIVHRKYKGRNASAIYFRFLQIKIKPIALTLLSAFFLMKILENLFQTEIFEDIQFEREYKMKVQKSAGSFSKRKKNYSIISSTNLTASQIKSNIYDCLFARISNEIPHRYDR